MKNKLQHFVARNAKRLAVVSATGMAMVQNAKADATDIAGVTTAITGYKNDAIIVGVAILLFVLGRKVVRKLI